MLYVNVRDRSLLDRPNMTELMQIKRIQTIQFCHDGKGPILYDIPALWLETSEPSVHEMIKWPQWWDSMALGFPKAFVTESHAWTLNL